MGKEKTTLDQVKAGAKFRFEKVLKQALELELSSFGLVPGDILEVFSRAPLGGPISLIHRGQSFALRKSQAKGIEGSAL